MVELMDHQVLAVSEMKNGCILWGGVGAGKSMTVAAYYMQNEAPRDVYVITTAKKRDSLDWEKEFVRFGVYKSKDATVAGVLTVDSWNNLGNYTDVHGAFFIFDEQRLVGSGAWTKAFLHIAKSNNWVLLSATPGDNWLDYIPVFLANGFYKNRTEFKREHVVYNTYSKFPKVDNYVGINKLVKLKNQVLVEMPYLRHTTRHTKYIDVDHDKESFHQALVQRWHVFEQRPIRDVAELFMVMRKIVNGDPSRLDVVKCLMQKHPKLIIFYNFNYELEILRTLANESTTKPFVLVDDSLSPRRSDLKSSRLSGMNSGFDPRSKPKTSTERESLPALTSETLDPKTSTSGSTGERTRSSQDGTTTSMPGQTRMATGSSSDSLEDSESSRGRDSRTGDSSDRTDEWSQSGGETSTTSALVNGPASGPDLDSASASFAVAEWNGHKHEEIPKTDRWVYLVQYTAGAEGWNCTETDAMVFYSLTYSYKQWHQAFGRIDRLNTPFTDLFYYVLRSSSVIDRAILNSLKLKKAFNESSMSIKF
jgi:hypothetical protein